MLRKKKANNKENTKIVKKTPLLTIPSFNFTEEIRIPTFASNELKSMMRSVEIRRSNPPLLTNNPKKAVSRKSGSKSVKLTPGFRPPKLKNIMRQFKQLKLIHEAQKSHSKSPLSCKSKSTGKHHPKRLSYPTLRTNPNSECNLTLKLERTIKKLNETDFFKDEDSLVPINSTSETFEVQQEREIISTDREQQIDMKQLREFCSTGSQAGKLTFGLTINSYGSFKQRAAALKIQRAWKRYQTKKLIERYASFSQEMQFSLDLQHHEQQLAAMEEQAMAAMQEQELAAMEQELNLCKRSEEIVIPSEDFYHQRMAGEKVRKISSLEQEEESSGQSGSQNYEELLQQMKRQELQKWNDLIAIISQTKSSNPREVEQLFQKIAEKSEENKKDLLAMQKGELSNSHKKKPHHIIEEPKEHKQPIAEAVKKEEAPVPSQPEEHPPARHFLSQSDPSYMEYDSRKYIDYLDGDMFPDQDKSSNSSHGQPTQTFQRTISRRKQQLLLNEMKMVNLPIKLGQSELYRSDSFHSLKPEHKTTHSRSRSGLTKSISEKALRRTLQHISEHLNDHSDEQINLDLLTREFLQGTDPAAENLDMVYGEEKLRSKLAELNQLKLNNNNEENREEEHEHLRNYQQSEFSEEREDSTDNREELRPQPAFELHRKDDDQIRVEEGSPEIREEANIVEILDSESERDDLDEDSSKRGQAVVGLIFNSLIFEVLKEIAKSESLSLSFKSQLRPRVRKTDNSKKKKGFPTDKKQIDHFLDSILAYLLREEPRIFKNLEVPTGPSALEMLKYMHQTADDSLSVDSQEDESNVMVIPNRVFEKFWQIKERSIVVEVPESFDHSNSLIFKQNFEYLKSFNKIYYRSLFDTLNQCLDCERNFGQHGKPFPWKRAPSFNHNKSDEQIHTSIGRARKRMSELSTTYCGLIIQREEMNGLQGNEEYITTVQEDRLSRMLATDLMESEPRWMFYDDEETEILIEVTNVLYAELLIEVIQDLHYLL